MKPFIQGAAKRLTFSLVALSALGGCAVYPANPGPYAYYGTGANGQAVYAAPPPVYAAPYYYDPLYVGPPVFFNFGFWGGHGGGGGRGRGGGGHGGGHGGGGHGGGGHGGGHR